MNSTELLKSISFNLSSVGKCKVETEWNYKDIISSFTRLYLVTEGEAYIYLGDKKINLRQGYLYLIPSFTHCSYLCESQMEHYYATFTIQFPNNFSVYQLFNFKYEIEATEEHCAFFKKLLAVNPNMALPVTDPKIYQRMNSSCWSHSIKDAQRSLSSSGLLYLLLSNFIDTPKIDLDKGDSNTILNVVKHIHMHLDKDLSISKLADMACLSTGHFTRKFKNLTQLAPLEYINKQRIEKAQMLLNTTSSSCVEIADLCGYKSNAYFCKIFKKYIGQSPSEFRVHRV